MIRLKSLLKLCDGINFFHLYIRHQMGYSLITCKNIEEVKKSGLLDCPVVSLDVLGFVEEDKFVKGLEIKVGSDEIATT